MPWPRSAYQPVSVLIPTKDRPAGLERSVDVDLAQTTLPSQIVIMHQTATDGDRRGVEALFASASISRKSVTHEPTIPGAAGGRNCAMAAADGLVWLFLDDDMEPEVDFIEQLQAVCGRWPAVGGVSGIAPNARIAHQPSPTERSEEHWVKEYAQSKLYVYHRNWQGFRNRLCCLWFQIGCALVAALGSVNRRSLEPWRAFGTGVRDAASPGKPVGSSPVQR